MTAENARKKNQIQSKFAANFQTNIIAMTVDNAVSQSTCFCEAYDIIFHNHKSFYMSWQHLIVDLSLLPSCVP